MIENRRTLNVPRKRQSTNVYATSDVSLAYDDVNRRKSEASRRPLQA